MDTEMFPCPIGHRIGLDLIKSARADPNQHVSACEFKHCTISTKVLSPDPLYDEALTDLALAERHLLEKFDLLGEIGLGLLPGSLRLLCRSSVIMSISFTLASRSSSVFERDGRKINNECDGAGHRHQE